MEGKEVRERWICLGYVLKCCEVDTVADCKWGTCHSVMVWGHGLESVTGESM